jgi:hypothetical protein
MIFYDVSLINRLNLARAKNPGIKNMSSHHFLALRYPRGELQSSGYDI